MNSNGEKNEKLISKSPTDGSDSCHPFHSSSELNSHPSLGLHHPSGSALTTGASHPDSSLPEGHPVTVSTLSAIMCELSPASSLVEFKSPPRSPSNQGTSSDLTGSSAFEYDPPSHVSSSAEFDYDPELAASIESSENSCGFFNHHSVRYDFAETLETRRTPVSLSPPPVLTSGDSCSCPPVEKPNSGSHVKPIMPRDLCVDDELHEGSMEEMVVTSSQPISSSGLSELLSSPRFKVICM